MSILLTIVFVLVVLAVVLAFGLALLSTIVARRVAAEFPPTGEWMDVEGERIHYRSLGNGPAIVFVHGLGGQSRNFDYLPLAELAQRWRLVLIDRPGSGLSPRADDRHAALPAQGRIVAAFIRAMRFDAPPLLVGHSLGGAVALSVALQDPACVRGLALIAPLTHFVPEVPRPFRGLVIRSPAVRRVVGRVLAVPMAVLMSQPTLAEVFKPDPVPADFGVRGGSRLAYRPQAFHGASTDLCAIEDDLPAQQARYGELRVPVRVLYGQGDAILDWRAQGETLVHAAPDAQLRVIPGGHMILVTAVPQTVAWLEHVARSLPGASA